jgi:hypothetical protein
MRETKNQMSKKKKFFLEKLDQEQPSTFSVSTFLTFKSVLLVVSMFVIVEENQLLDLLELG